MSSYHTSEIVKTEAMLGGVTYRLYTRQRLSNRLLAVSSLVLTERDLDHAQMMIADEKHRHWQEAQQSLPF